VLDPFAGSGTTGAAAAELGRRFVLFDINPEYINLMREAVPHWPNVTLNSMMWLNCPPAEPVLKQTHLLEKNENDNYQ
jgi:hypothetical protein